MDLCPMCEVKVKIYKCGLCKLCYKDTCQNDGVSGQDDAAHDRCAKLQYGYTTKEQVMPKNNDAARKTLSYYNQLEQIKDMSIDELEVLVAEDVRRSKDVIASFIELWELYCGPNKLALQEEKRMRSVIV